MTIVSVENILQAMLAAGFKRHKSGAVIVPGSVKLSDYNKVCNSTTTRAEVPRGGSRKYVYVRSSSGLPEFRRVCDMRIMLASWL